ncbi:hypothetical protein VTO73DRAFT_12269 [Trametes versicolor]
MSSRYHPAKLANRGIGLEIVTQLVASPNNLVIAACRTPEKATALNDLKRSARGMIHIIKIDVSDFDSIRASTKALQALCGETGLDYLINNAGIIADDTASTLDPERLLELFKTNAAGPALVSQVCLPFMKKGSTRKILHVSSTAGSIGSLSALESPRGLFTSYAMSKAALNMLAYKQKLENPDFTVITLCPGWVKTDMGGKAGLLEPHDSVTGILKVITSATVAESGKYLRYNGEEIPW